MRAIPFNQIESHLRETLDQVCDDRDPVIITRENDRSVVVVSLDEWTSMEETTHLLKSPRNAARLLRSMGDLEQGRGLEKDLED